MKIIDAFTFFNEIDLLKIRLELLYNHVDTFVICESNLTHAGKDKKYHFLENHKHFKKWEDKIVLQQYEPNIAGYDFSIKDDSYNPESASWKLETGQRNYLSSYLTHQNSEDIAFICDVDEIWQPILGDALRNKELSLECARLEMQFHYYFLNCRGIGNQNSKWLHPFYSKVALIKQDGDLSKKRVHENMPSIGNAGWHFSYLGGAQKVSEKIDAFAHQETNTAEINNLKYLERCIHLGIDHLNRPDHEWAFHPIDYYPEELSAQMKKYPHLIKASLL